MGIQELIDQEAEKLKRLKQEPVVAVSIKATKITADILKKVLDNVITDTKEQGKEIKYDSLEKIASKSNQTIVEVPLSEKSSEKVLQDVAKYCKKNKVKFSVLKDDSESPPKTILCFQNKDLAKIQNVMKGILNNLTKDLAKTSIEPTLNKASEICKEQTPKETKKEIGAR